jgi:hypothetical protein
MTSVDSRLPAMISKLPTAARGRRALLRVLCSGVPKLMALVSSAYRVHIPDVVTCSTSGFLSII